MCGKEHLVCLPKRLESNFWPLLLYDSNVIMTKKLDAAAPRSTAFWRKKLYHIQPVIERKNEVARMDNTNYELKKRAFIW